MFSFLSSAQEQSMWHEGWVDGIEGRSNRYKTNDRKTRGFINKRDYHYYVVAHAGGITVYYVKSILKSAYRGLVPWKA